MAPPVKPPPVKPVAPAAEPVKMRRWNIGDQPYFRKRLYPPGSVIEIPASETKAPGWFDPDAPEGHPDAQPSVNLSPARRFEADIARIRAAREAKAARDAETEGDAS